MNILLAFAPFLVFVVLERAVGVEPGLLGAAATALAFLLRDVLPRTQAPKVLEVGTVLLFGGLALYGALAGADWSTAGVRLAVVTLPAIVGAARFTGAYPERARAGAPSA